jgi:hypothetical protein
MSSVQRVAARFLQAPNLPYRIQQALYELGIRADGGYFTGGNTFTAWWQGDVVAVLVYKSASKEWEIIDKYAKKAYPGNKNPKAPLTPDEEKKLAKANVYIMDVEMDGGRLPSDVQKAWDQNGPQTPANARIILDYFYRHAPGDFS